MYGVPVNYQYQWGSGGNTSPVPLEKVRTGWFGTEKPLVEQMNWLFNRLDHAVGYLLQGARWLPDLTYPSGSFVNHEGELYRATEDNTNSKPSDLDKWEKAYASFTNLQLVDERLSKIINEDGYLEHYVKVSEPVSPNRFKGGSFEANIGSATPTVYNVGYSFKGRNTTGMYLDREDNLNLQVNGVVKGKFPPADPTLSDKSTTVATTDWVQRLIDEKMKTLGGGGTQLPVGAVFISIDPQNPSETLGYGSWVKFAEGLTLVGHSTKDTDPDWKKTVLNTFGEDSVRLTQAQMPTHNHPKVSVNGSGAFARNLAATQALFVEQKWADTSSTHNGVKNPAMTDLYGDGGTLGDNNWLTYQPHINTAGGDEAHNNVQPSIIVYIWRRTA